MSFLQRNTSRVKTVTCQPASPKNVIPSRRLRPGTEVMIALAGTLFMAFLLLLTAMNAGPLWRDEVNTANLAQMPSLKEFWNNMPYESFPPLWPLLLRGCGQLGLVGSDASIRVLGLLVGLGFLASLWATSRWIGARAPILSVALLGSLPAFIFIIGANRAYGLASCLLVLSFGTIWRMVELPSRPRIFWAGLTCFLFAHCVYYDVVFLCAILAGGAVVVIQRRQWKTLLALAVIGVLCCSSLAIYLPTIHQGSAYVPMNQNPNLDYPWYWQQFGKAVADRSSAHEPRLNRFAIWLWGGLVLDGLALALVMQRIRDRQLQGYQASALILVRTRADRALFSVVSMSLGIVVYLIFLMKLQYPTQNWYYVEMLCLCAVSFDGIYGANWPALRPWGLLRIGFMTGMIAWMAGAAWEESHTRRSNVDAIAAVLSQNASERDLIVVQTVWEGITFNRYYHGGARWVTVPPLEPHEVHRNDLVFAQMNQPDPMAAVLREVTNTLRAGNSVWIVGAMAIDRPRQLPPPPKPHTERLLPYMSYWSDQVMVLLHGHALQEQILKIPVNGPVNFLENLPVKQFKGFKETN
jgi:hypothetical protein